MDERLPAGHAMVSFADLLLTCDVPAVDLSGTSWDGTDDGERSKRPVTCAVLTMLPVSHGPLRDRRAAGSDGALALERRAMITRIYEGNSQTQRMVTAHRHHPLRCPARSGWRARHETRWGMISAGDRPQTPILLYKLQLRD